MTQTTPLELLPIFTRALELCAVGPGEVVGVYTENGVRRNYADAYVAAAESLGATAFVVDMPVPSGPIW